MSLHIIILAAGKGTRMKSAMPKVLHPLGGQPLLSHVLQTAHALKADKVTVVYGHGGEAVPNVIDDNSLDWVLQSEQLGTGHAVKLALDSVEDASDVLVMYGDVPLTRESTLRELIDQSRAAATLSVLTMMMDEPGSYGRIVREDNHVMTGIVEAKDADPKQLAIREINTGFIAAPATKLKRWVSSLGTDNAQGEYYLTDIVSMAAAEGEIVASATAGEQWEIEGVNNRAQLAALERIYQQNRATTLMMEGVTLADPSRIDVRGSLDFGKDGYVDVNVVFEGDNVIGENVTIGPNCVIINSRVESGTTLRANCVLDHAHVGEACLVGPFARLRPGTELAAGVHIGNFVETKKTTVGAGSKINHLSYVGDSEVGRDVNIGAGVITCNYDGVNKHKTIIKDNAFVGSDSQLIAPVVVGEGAYIGSGTTLSRNAPDGELTLTRSPQRTIKGWTPPAKKSDT